MYEEVLLDPSLDRRLVVEDLRTWHRLWLGNVYEWAGRERSVNMSKGTFMFAPAAQIQRLLADFERDVLARWTPCHHFDQQQLVEAIAVVHVEFILIHPFREGNGRLSRLLADVMAVQAGRDSLDYRSWEQRKAEYIGAIHAGLARDYAPMRRFVALALGAEEAEVSERE